MKSTLRVVLVCWGIFGAGLLAAADDPATVHSVTIVTGSQTDGSLEFMATQELRSLLKRRCGITATVSETMPKSGAVILLGSAKSNPAIAKIPGQDSTNKAEHFPQSIQITSFFSPEKEGVHGLVLGGNSPVATLWAVYEFGEQLGVRYLLRGDLFPTEIIPLKLKGYHLYQRPSLTTRGFRIMENTPGGFSGWSTVELQKVIRQLAKLKFNLVQFSIHSTQPFAPFDFQGVQRETAVLWNGRKFELVGDAPGRSAFGGRRSYENPDFPRQLSSHQRVTAAQKMLRTLIDTAHEVGIAVDFEFAPVVFPKELAAFVPGCVPAPNSNGLTYGPGPRTSLSDSALLEVAASQIRGVRDAYPRLDSITLRVADTTLWQEQFAAARTQLRIPENALPAQVAPLLAAKTSIFAFYQKLLVRSSNEPTRVVFPRLHLGNVPAELASYAPPGVPANVLLDPENAKTLEGRSGQPRLAEIPLSTSTTGVLPQNSLSEVHQTLQSIRPGVAQGFVATCWTIAEVDPSVQYLSDRAFDSQATPQSVYLEFFTAVTGKRDAGSRMARGFESLNRATALLKQNAPNFCAPSENMLVKHFVSEKLPPWWKTYNDLAVEWDTECYRAHDACAQYGRPLLFYYAKRSEFQLEYAGGVDLLREAAALQEQKSLEKAAEKLEKGVESIYNAIHHLALPAQDSSDLAMIALLNVYAHQPLVALFEKFQAAAEQSSSK